MTNPTSRFALLAWTLLGCLQPGCAPGEAGTFVHLTLNGAAPDGVVRSRLELTLDGKRATTELAPTDSDVLLLPTDVTLAITSGAGLLDLLATLEDAQGAALRIAYGSTEVIRGETAEAAIVFEAPVTAPERAPAVDGGDHEPPRPMLLAEATHDFGLAIVDNLGGDKQLTIRNVSTIATATLKASLSGVDANEFEIVDDACSTKTLDAHSECAVRVRLRPHRVGALIATLTVSEASAAVAISLVGESVAPSALVVSPGSVTFDTQLAGAMSPSIKLDILNMGPVPSGDLSVTFVGTDAESFLVDPSSCGPSLGAGASCAVFVTFSSSTVGSRQATLVIRAASAGITPVQLFGSSYVGLVVTRDLVDGANGTVVSAQPGVIDCGATCSAQVSMPSLTLHAIPSPGFYFGGWSGDCAGFDDCNVSMDASRTLTARFVPANKMFVTAGRYTRSEIKALGGVGTESAKMLAGADERCRRDAVAAGLTGTWKAWISGAGASAASRIEATQARGWVRADGSAFADELTTNAGAGGIFYPPKLTQSGAVVVMTTVDYRRTWTGTRADGSIGDTCNDWSSASSTLRATIGDDSAGTSLWTDSDAFSFLCSHASAMHLYCLQTDYAAKVAPPQVPAEARRIFVTTSTLQSGAGIAGADALCAQQGATLGGAWSAMLATTTATIASRFTVDARPIYRTDGVRVALNSAALFGAADLEAAIASDPSLSERLAWTGALSANSLALASANCADWTSTAGSAKAGRPNTSMRTAVFGYATLACNVARPVLCLEK